MITNLGMRDRAAWWFILQSESPRSWQEKHAVLSFVNLRRVSNWWKQTLTKVQRLQRSHNVLSMLLLCYIHKTSGENILAKGSLKWNSGSIQEERGDAPYQARGE